MKKTVPELGGSGTLMSSRREFIKYGVAAGAMIAAPSIFASDPGNVVVRSLGGAYQEAMEAAVYKPFTEATGIKVIVQPATAGQIRAMVDAGRVQIDVVDLQDAQLAAFERLGALEPIDYAGMKFTNPADIRPSVRTPYYVGALYFATVLVYNTEEFKPGTHPKTWSQFWDTEKFKGPRTLADQRSGAAELEFANLADGCSVGDLYPLDLDRAFKSLGNIKGAVVKWWDTGAVSAQLLERKEAVLGAIWNGRAQALIDKGAPLAIEWNQAKQQIQSWGVMKGSQNKANAQRFIDFALQPKVQANITNYIAYGPSNIKAFEYISDATLKKLPSSPENYAGSFEQNAAWWSEHTADVGARWQSWILQRG